MTVFAQVSRWLRERDADGWILAGGAHRRLLVEQWRDVVLRYGDESHPACGVLLALVREALQDPHLFVEYVASTNDHRIACDFDVSMRLWETSGKASLSGFKTEVEALAAALMAAPTKQEGP